MTPIQRSTWFERFWAIAGAASVRVKVLGIVLGVIILLGLIITVQLRAALTRTLLVELEHQGLAIGENIAEQTALLLDNPNALDAVLHERQVHFTGSDHNTHVAYIILHAPDGQVIAHTFEGAVPGDLLALPAERAGRVAEIQRAGGRVVDIASPLPRDQGVLRLGLADIHIAQTVDTVTWEIVTITLVMIAVGFVAAFFLTWILTRPISTLVEATKAVAAGDFTRQVRRWANDEIGDLADAFNRMTRALAQAEAERAGREALRESYIHGVIRAQEDERKRIARELHDSTSQALTSLLVSLRNLESAPPEQLKARIEAIRAVAGATLDEVHALAWQLRPSVLDDLGLVAALERYVNDYRQRYGIQVDFITRGLCERPPLELETSLYRIVQEALTNIARHAHARNASILIEQRKNSLRVIVEDDGVGFDPRQIPYSEKSLGLQGIRERAQLFGGTVTIESQPGQGTSVFVELPLDQRETP